jgi:hypothetical protein
LSRALAIMLVAILLLFVSGGAFVVLIAGAIK